MFESLTGCSNAIDTHVDTHVTDWMGHCVFTCTLCSITQDCAANCNFI